MARLIHRDELFLLTEPVINNKKRIRGGIILYKIVANELYFLVCIERKSKKINVLGGGINNYETVIQGCKRELFEETIGLFNISEELLNSIPPSHILRMREEFIYLLPTNAPFDIINDFQNRKKIIEDNLLGSLLNFNNVKIKIGKQHNEIEELVWITIDTLSKMPTNKRVLKIFKPWLKTHILSLI